MSWRLLVLLFVSVNASAATGGTCSKNPSAAAAVGRLREAMAQGRFIAYEPTSLRMFNGKATEADADSIRADLTALRPRFDSLITYGVLHGADKIPTIAASLKFRAVIIGVWDPLDHTELDTAVSLAKNPANHVVGLSLGNEVVFSHRASF